MTSQLIRVFCIRLGEEHLAGEVATETAGMRSTPGPLGRGIRVLRNSGCCLTSLPMGNTITIRLPEELGQWLEEEAKLTGLPKGRIVREQLELSRTRKARQPFLDLAGSVEGTPGLSRKRGFRP